MKTLPEVTRRDLLKIGLGATGTLAAHTALGRSGACGGPTPAQAEGPFYPAKNQPDKDNDLTRVRGRSRKARGQVIYLVGRVVDENCQPLRGALVEIWQACVTGKYNHAGDPNPAALDPNFQYWGRDVSHHNGFYRFKTIIPGAYPASDGWVRPPHIHMKVHRRGFSEFITQVYFSGHKLNSKDRVLMSLSPQDRRKVIVPFRPTSSKRAEPGSLMGRFDIVLKNI